MPVAGRVYTAWTEYGLPGYLLRGIVAAACLLPPSSLMGATLPALARRVEVTANGRSWLGFLYAVNIGGAVFGCLLSGFYLLREFDVVTATLAAAGINLAMAGVAFALARRVGGNNVPVFTGPEGLPSSQVSNTPVYLAVGLSGFCAIAAESIFTRTMGLLFGASVYTLSILLSVYLVGLGIGSGIASLLVRSLVRPRVLLACCQLLAAGAITWTSYSLSASLPYWPIDPSLSSSVWLNFQLDLARAFWALLPPTLLWGATFPLAVAAVSPNRQDSARLFAGVFGANTLGAIAGALVAGIVLIAWVGTQHAEQLLISVSLMAGLVLLLPDARRSRIAFCIICMLFGGLFIYSVPAVPGVLIAYGRYASTWVGKSDIIYSGEGMNSSVAVSSFANGTRTFHVAGKIQASTVPRDMRLQRMLGHLTTLTSKTPRSVMVIGCGAGITAGAVSIDPEVKQVTIVEIEPLVPKAAADYFREQNFDVIGNPKVTVRIDDGRHYLLTTPERFDAITIDPLDPWVKGAANLYTKEFYEAARRHLNPGGVMTMYIQLFETNENAVKSSLATFFEVFPNGTVWGNTYQDQGHDMVLLGQVDPLRIDLDKMEKRYETVAASLREVGMNDAVGLFSTYAGRASDLKNWLRGAPINRDRNLRMQYLAGLSLNLDDSADIYRGLLKVRRFPEEMFTSREGRVDALRNVIR
jgi:spermidine synthase